MKTNLYYLSGTGNSFKAAKDLAQRLGETRLLPITHDCTPDTSAERIGIIFPVIMFGIPGMITRFIKKLSPSCRDRYLFSVITYGGELCASMRQVAQKLRSRGLSLSRGFAVRMNRTEEDLARWDTTLDAIAAAIAQRETVPVSRVSFADGLRTYAGNAIARSLIPGMDKKFDVSAHCDGCGICASLCPAGNISISEGKPVWHHRCEQCFACMNWCPPKAVGFGKSAERYRYTHPDVTAEDLLLQRQA